MSLIRADLVERIWLRSPDGRLVCLQPGDAAPAWAKLAPELLEPDDKPEEAASGRRPKPRPRD